MKYLFYLLFFISIGIGIAGCSLDEEIYDRAMSDTFVKSEGDVLSLVNGVYSFLPTFDCYKANLPYQILYGGDDIATTGAQQRSFADRSVTASDRYFITPWVGFYKTINNANSVIQILGNTDVVSEEFRNRILGEMYFMRSFSYFNLVRLQGGVPIRKEPTTGSSDFYMPRNSVEEVYDFVFEDLKKATEMCLPYSKQSATEFGQATKGAAQAILSLAYLTYANYLDLNGKGNESGNYYQLAENYADSVILSNEYSLLSNYADLFDVNKEKNAYKEVIFAIQHTRDATAASASSLGSELAYYTQPSYRYNVCGNVTNGAGTGTLRIQPWFYDICSTGDYKNDYRTEVSFVTRFKDRNLTTERITYPEVRKANEGTEQFPYLNKYIDPDGLQARNNENDFFIIRLSEIYLIKAEAENELNGPTAEAYTAFNKLRERARLANGTARTTPANLQTGLTKEEFRLKIFNERGLELVGEGHRWFDSVRMRYIDNQRTMVQYRYEDFYPTIDKTIPVYNTATKTWGGGRAQPLNVVSWTPKFLIWAIPSSEIDANPKMTQNSEFGW